ncbi:MAG: bile acid:sodium symporter, partial [Cyanobacteria bacterium P01_D01_bin.115]
MESAESVSLPVGQTILQVFLLTLLPAILGVAFNRILPKLSERLQQPLKYINVALLGLVFTIKFFAGESQGGSGINTTDILAILPYALMVNLGSIAISYFAAKAIRLANRQAVTIGIEVGLQNTTLALLVTGT